MIIKDKFELLKNEPNLIDYPVSKLRNLRYAMGNKIIFVNLNQISNRINHFTKDRIFSEISNVKEREKKQIIINDPSYTLTVSHSKIFNNRIINLGPFNIKEILPDKPGANNLYALMVYSITFSDLVSKRFKVNNSFVEPISNYIVSLFLRMFGKQYGLLGSFSRQIPRLKFFVNFYVLNAFFGITGNRARSMAISLSGAEIPLNELNKLDFTQLGDLIKSLSIFEIMPNLNKQIFTSKLLMVYGISFFPALEDLSRFIAILTTADIKGSNIIPTHLNKINEREFNRILNISKGIFR